MTDTTVHVHGGDPREIGAQVGRAIRTLRERAPRPVVPRPLWQRDQLFLEPDLPEQTDLDDDDEDDRAP